MLHDKLLFAITWMLAAALSSCQHDVSHGIQIVVTNETDHDLHGVVDGVPLQALLDSLNVPAGTPICLTNEMGEQVITQVFNNGQLDLLLFESSTLAHGESSYRVTVGEGQKATIDTATSVHVGYYPKPDANSAWDNDSALWQAYEPELRAALVCNGRIDYPRSWKAYEVQANGPLLAAITLHSDTLVVNSDTIFEHRTIVTQMGTRFNIVNIQYDGLTSGHDMAVGIAYHGDADSTKSSLSGRYIVNSARMSQQGDVSGRRVIGAYVPTMTRSALELGHLLAYSIYRPGDTFTYYVGCGWSSGDCASLDQMCHELEWMSERGHRIRITAN